MKITTDHAFHIGSQHLRSGMPCQDYATSLKEEGVSCSVLSDGCSSGGNTDVGSRIIALNTACTLLEYAGDEEATIDTVCDARDLNICAGLGLTMHDMLATCAYVMHLDDSAEVLARLVGDGVIASVDVSGNILMEKFEWNGNMPFYRIYRHVGIERFLENHGGREALAVSILTHARLDGVPQEQEDWCDVDTAIAGHRRTIDTRGSPFVAVFSDGVTQVDGMDWRDVVAELMSFKSTEGDFVKRRMNRFLKDCLKHGKGPIDDISMACIHVQHEAA